MTKRQLLRRVTSAFFAVWLGSCAAPADEDMPEPGNCDAALTAGGSCLGERGDALVPKKQSCPEGQILDCEPGPKGKQVCQCVDDGPVIPPVVKTADAQIVDWGQLRMEQIDTVMQRVFDVQDGTTPRSSLAGLGDDATIDALLASATRPVEAQTTGLHMMSLSNGGGGGGVSTCLYCNYGGASTVDYFPKSIDLHELKAGQTRTGRVILIAPVETDVNVRIADTSTVGGIFTPRWEVTKLTTFTSVWQPKHQNPTVSVDQTSTTRSIHVRAGQELAVDFRFRSSSDDAALFRTVMFIESAAWPNIVVPLKAVVTLMGPEGSIVASYAGAWKTLKGSSVDVPLTLINVGAARTATLTATTLPSGVTMSPLTVQFAAGATQNVTLHFDVPAEAATGYEQPIEIALHAAGVDETLGLSASVYDPIFTWHANLDAGTVHGYQNGSAKADGSWTWHVSIHDNAVIIGDKFQIDFSYVYRDKDGNIAAVYRPEQGRLGSDTVGGDNSKNWDQSGASDEIRDNFFAIVDNGVHWDFQVTDDPTPFLVALGVAVVTTGVGIIVPILLTPSPKKSGGDDPGGVPVGNGGN